MRRDKLDLFERFIEKHTPHLDVKMERAEDYDPNEGWHNYCIGTDCAECYIRLECNKENTCLTVPDIKYLMKTRPELFI